MFATAAAIFSLLLIATGAAKAVSPDDTDRALRSMWVRVPSGSARVLGIAEILIGVFALTGLSNLWWILQALIYLAFLGWVVVAMVRTVPLESCGCLGTPDTPPYWGHLLVDAVAVLMSLGAALAGDVFLAFPGAFDLVAQLGIAALGGFLAWVIIGDGARLHGAVRT